MFIKRLLQSFRNGFNYKMCETLLVNINYEKVSVYSLLFYEGLSTFLCQVSFIELRNATLEVS